MARAPISYDQISQMEVDDSDGRLYWKGKPVLVEQRLSLRRYELALATIAAGGAFLAGVHPFGASFGWW
jgi:hypothetical protein